MTEEEKADARAAIEEEDRLAEEEAIRHAKREQRHARVLVALFSVALLWCSSFAVSDANRRGAVRHPRTRRTTSSST